MLGKKDWLLEPHQPIGFKKNEIFDRLEALPYVHHTEIFYFNVPSRYALINITSLVEAAITRAKVKDGFCFISTMHITAGIYVNDAEMGLLSDISSWIENLAPFGKNYQHHQTGEDNGDAHLKSYLTNHTVTVPITRSRAHLGTWQQVFYAEFDGKREKRVLLKITGLSGC